MVAGELGQLLDHHGLGRHVDADRQRLGGEHHLDQPLDEARLDDLLERRHHPGVVGGDARLELGEERAVAEHGEVGGIDRPQAGVDDLADAIALGAGGQPRAGGQHCLGGLVALVAAEDEVDRRQHPVLLEQIDDLEPRRREQAAAAPAPRRVAAGCPSSCAPPPRRGGPRRCSSGR